jgi:hypothetical protein
MRPTSHSAVRDSKGGAPERCQLSSPSLVVRLASSLFIFGAVRTRRCSSLLVSSTVTADPARCNTHLKKIMMQHTATYSSKGSAQSQNDRGCYVVLSLADQRLTLEHDETLQPFEKRMLDQDSKNAEVY